VLADADEADSELRQGDNATGELTYGKDAPGGNGQEVRAVLERDVGERESEQGHTRFVLKSPAVPFFPYGQRRTAMGTRDRLLGYFMSACSTGFHTPDLVGSILGIVRIVIGKQVGCHISFPSVTQCGNRHSILYSSTCLIFAPALGGDIVSAAFAKHGDIHLYARDYHQGFVI